MTNKVTKVTKVKDPKAVEHGKKAWQANLKKHTAKILAERSRSSQQSSSESSTSNTTSSTTQSSNSTQPTTQSSSGTTLYYSSLYHLILLTGGVVSFLSFIYTKCTSKKDEKDEKKSFDETLSAEKTAEKKPVEKVKGFTMKT